MPPIEHHTKAQQQFHRFLDTNFQCPRCGTTTGKGEFYVDDTVCPLDPPNTDFSDCEMLHKGDICCCDACGWAGTAQQVYNAAKRKHGWKPCSCCNGTGFEKVKKE